MRPVTEIVRRWARRVAYNVGPWEQRAWLSGIVWLLGRVAGVW